jgi:hypothetical protein
MDKSRIRARDRLQRLRASGGALLAFSAKTRSVGTIAFVVKANAKKVDESGFPDEGKIFLIARFNSLQGLKKFKRTVPGHWLTQPRQLNNRARIWHNLRRIALALETLHAQGLLHRNLDTWAVLTGGSDEADFQLTGFEWSMRIVGAHA